MAQGAWGVNGIIARILGVRLTSCSTWTSGSVAMGAGSAVA